jgi:hypothetical protein
MLPEKICHQVVRQSVRTFVPNSCPAHNFVIWSRILQLFQINNHHIETTCSRHYLGRYLESQGHTMTLQQNRVRPITSLFDVRFYIYFTEMIILLRPRVTHNIWVATLKIKVTAWPCSKCFAAHIFVIWSRILQLFHRMIIILLRRVARNIWVVTLKAKVTASHCVKWCLAHNFVIWSRILQLFYRNDHHFETTWSTQVGR